MKKAPPSKTEGGEPEVVTRACARATRPCRKIASTGKARAASSSGFGSPVDSDRSPKTEPRHFKKGAASYAPTREKRRRRKVAATMRRCRPEAGATK